MYWCAPQPMVDAWVQKLADERLVTTTLGERITYDDVLDLGSRKRLRGWDRLRADNAMESIAALVAGGDPLPEGEGPGLIEARVKQ